MHGPAKRKTRFHCGSALQVAERDGQHIGSHLWRGAELLAKWIEQNFSPGELEASRACRFYRWSLSVVVVTEHLVAHGLGGPSWRGQPSSWA